ncbi:MAG: hypothetical protein KAS02_01855 [Candidatus Pacebacteria bacterium]|nr:hypothetical protein [Candidatus Paceibacterota bacterium]
MKKSIEILFLVGVFFIAGALSLNAWTGPTSAPPGDNTDAPLNVGSTNQTKLGALIFPNWYDEDDITYYVDPSATSKFRTIKSTGQNFINNVSPTIYMQDTNNRSAMIHANNNYFYVLRGSGTNSTTWEAYNGKWPLTINLENNNAYFGGSVLASLYYDRDDTDYYLNPAGTSVFNAIKLGGVSRDTWPDGGDGGTGTEVDTLQSVVSRGAVVTDTALDVPAIWDYNDHSYFLNPSMTTVLKDLTVAGGITLGGIYKTSWPDGGGSGGMEAANVTSCENRSCSGTNSVVFPIKNGYGEANARPAICYGDWSINTTYRNFYSSCSTGWIWSAHCGNTTGGTFSNCPIAGGYGY